MSGAAQAVPGDQLQGIADIADKVAQLSAQVQQLSAQVRQQFADRDARTGEMEQFVEGLKPGAPEPVVRVPELHRATQELETNWQAGDDRVRGELQPALQQVQTLAQKLGERVEAIETRVPASGTSEWLQNMVSCIETASEDVSKRATDQLLADDGQLAKRLLDSVHAQMAHALQQHQNSTAEDLQRFRDELRTMQQEHRRNSLYTGVNDRVEEALARVEEVRTETLAQVENVRKEASAQVENVRTRVNQIDRDRVMRDFGDLDSAHASGASPGYSGSGASRGVGTGFGRGGMRAGVGLRDGGARESQAADDNSGGATPMRRSRPSVFMPNAVPMPTDPEAPDNAVSASTYYLTAAQVLDARFADEDCPESLAEGDPDAPRDPKYEKDLPDEALWYGKRTMYPCEEVKNQGFYDALRKLQQHFKREHIITSRRRLTALEKMIVPDAERSHFLDMVKVREHTEGRRLTYEEARRLGLDLFSPSDWLAQALSVWRRNLDQGAKPGSKWLASMLQYRKMCDNMIPGGQQAFSDAFFALLLRAGVSNAIETELARTDYAVYNPAEALTTINEVSRRLPNDGAGSKASVNRAQGFFEMDAEAVAAVKMVREMAEVNRTAVVYSGALAELLRERGISEPEFQRRKQDKECVWCKSKEHFLFSCPDYTAKGLDKSRAQGRQQGKVEYKQQLQNRVLSRADAHRHFRRTGEVAGAHANVHAQANVVSAGSEAAAKVERGRTLDRTRFAPVTDTRSLSRGLSASSASSAGSEAYELLSEDEAGAENGSGEGR